MIESVNKFNRTLVQNQSPLHGSNPLRLMMIAAHKAHGAAAEGSDGAAEAAGE